MEKLPYTAPKLTEIPVSSAMHKAAIDAAKNEARCELLELVMDEALKHYEVADHPLLLTLHAWQEAYEVQRRKSIDSFVELVQQKLTAEHRWAK